MVPVVITYRTISNSVYRSSATLGKVGFCPPFSWGRITDAEELDFGSGNDLIAGQQV